MGLWSNGGRLRLGDRTSTGRTVRSSVARIERSEIRDRPSIRQCRPRVSLALNPGYAATPPEFSRSLRNSCYRDRSGARLDRRGAVQVRLDRGGAGAEPRAVDLQILHDPLDVVARLGERDALDPVGGIDLGIARIAVLCHPLLDSA